jgi:HSP20 family protein
MKSLITYKPYDLINIDPFSLLDSVFANDVGFDRETRIPAVDIREAEKSFLIEAELPGLAESDIELKVERGNLVLIAKKASETEEGKDTYLRRERSAWNFTRTFGLPENVDENAISASFRNGVLTVELPKKPESEPKKIAVKVA